MTYSRVAVLTQSPDGALSLATADKSGVQQRVPKSTAEIQSLIADCIKANETLLLGAGNANALEYVRRAAWDSVGFWPEAGAGTPVLVAQLASAALDVEVAALVARVPQSHHSAQALLLAQAYFALADQDSLDPFFEVQTLLLGEGHELALRKAVPVHQTPPRLRNDCFAMPQGVDWVPVDKALSKLREILQPITGIETCSTDQALGRVLAADCFARRSNPPMPNSAVDGFGFAHAATGSGPQSLPLVEGRAAAGEPFDGTVPFGASVRILTGAILPAGVDTVVLEEDTATDGASVVFDGPIKANANTRRAGEDVAQEDLALGVGHRLRAPDLALLCALGRAQVTVYRPLRVGVLSTGNEIVSSPATEAAPHQIWDANRPMLLGLAKGWGFEPVDLGHVQDDEELIEQRLNDGAKQADVIFTSGGASAGDEDHVSALLRKRGTLSSWRIALKPGRPLALAMWDGVPVFGLPGNPVAAMVCTLIFGRPALSAMSGEGWRLPQGFMVPAAFEKTKKAGRREYLRARLNNKGDVEVFKSEGSGRISGLSWATGLVELGDEAAQIKPGTLVRYVPYSSFGV